MNWNLFFVSLSVGMFPFLLQIGRFSRMRRGFFFAIQLATALLLAWLVPTDHTTTAALAACAHSLADVLADVLAWGVAKTAVKREGRKIANGYTKNYW